MNTRFHVDLLHPGWVAETWQDWFTGPQGGRRLALAAVTGIAVLAGVVLAGILPAHWRLSSDRQAVPAMRRDLEARDTDLGLLRSNLQALSREARRQVSWTELLTTLSRHMPATLKLQLVETTRVAPPPLTGQPASPAPKAEDMLHIEALTPLRPGGPPLLDVAQFITALMREPMVSRRFALRSWEIKPSAAQSPSGEQLLTVSIWLTERAE